jgi:DNA-binding GntR family transcriptional regulator
VPRHTRRVDLDHSGPEPVYRQIAAILRGRIERGQYQSGQPIPSIERIRQETGCSVETIRKAVRILAGEGAVRIVPGKGTFVA